MSKSLFRAELQCVVVGIPVEEMPLDGIELREWLSGVIDAVRLQLAFWHLVYVSGKVLMGALGENVTGIEENLTRDLMLHREKTFLVVRNRSVLRVIVDILIVEQRIRKRLRSWIND